MQKTSWARLPLLQTCSLCFLYKGNVQINCACRPIMSCPTLLFFSAKTLACSCEFVSKTAAGASRTPCINVRGKQPQRLSQYIAGLDQQVPFVCVLQSSLPDLWAQPGGLDASFVEFPLAILALDAETQASQLAGIPS